MAEEDEGDKKCIFCKIARGKIAETELLYQDENYVAFRDHRPAGEHHYLVIPKRHMTAVGSLRTEGDAIVVERLRDIADQLLRERGVADDADRQLGFHWPFYTVAHLHLHAISPTNQKSFFQRIEYSSALFGTVDQALQVIRKKSGTQ